MSDAERTIRTEDGKTVREGDRAFNYYDGYWVTVGPIDSEGWATCTGDDGRHAALNGQRLASYDPKGSTDPKPGPGAVSQDVSIRFPLSVWKVADTDRPDPRTRLTATVTVNGLPMFFEAWQMRFDENDMQTTVDPEFAESFDRLHAAVRASDAFQTTTIDGREYIILATPHS